MFQVESIDLEGDSRVTLMRHRRVGLVEGVFMDVSIVLPAMRCRPAVHSGHLRGEVGRSLRGLLVVS